MLLGYAGGSWVDVVREALEGTGGLVLIGAGVAALALALPMVRRTPTGEANRLGHDLLADRTDGDLHEPWRRHEGEHVPHPAGAWRQVPDHRHAGVHGGRELDLA
jgi:hypothetical protein